MLAKLLAKSSSLPVVEAKNRAELRKLYLRPPRRGRMDIDGISTVAVENWLKTLKRVQRTKK